MFFLKVGTRPRSGFFNCAHPENSASVLFLIAINRRAVKSVCNNRNFKIVFLSLNFREWILQPALY